MLFKRMYKKEFKTNSTADQKALDAIMYYEEVVAGLQCQIDANKVQSQNQVESGSVIDKENV
jgi:hypothetical protein